VHIYFIFARCQGEVGAVTRLHVTQPKNRSSIPGEKINFHFLQNCPDRLWVPYSFIFIAYWGSWPIPVAARSKAWVCGRSLARTWTRGHGCLSLVSVVCCQVEVSASGWSLVQRSPAECGVSKCDREASIMRRPWPTRGCRAVGEKNVVLRGV
jgi:hypothetical protein